VEVGFAETVVPVVALNPEEGAHVYVTPPFAEMLTELPIQTDGLEGLEEITGRGFTVTRMVCVRVHPFPSVPVTV
jgi:hypothetical protein